jgi:hypothetical protein
MPPSLAGRTRPSVSFTAAYSPWEACLQVLHRFNASTDAESVSRLELLRERMFARAPAGFPDAEDLRALRATVNPASFAWGNASGVQDLAVAVLNVLASRSAIPTPRLVTDIRGVSNRAVAVQMGLVVGPQLGPGPRRATAEGPEASLPQLSASALSRASCDELVGAVLVELDLGVESLFADPDRERARAGREGCQYSDLA